MHTTLVAALLGGFAAAAPGGDHHPHHKDDYKEHYGGGSGSPTVSIKNGTVSGLHTDNYGGQDYFLGIPFAQPPVNDLRFRLAQSIDSPFEGTYEATEYAPLCVGYGGDQLGYPEAEDCLYLNVVRPSGCEGQDLPVGVWIHGGGLRMGGTQDARYNLSAIVENSVEIGKPIIGVSIAYRLSAWGFLASQEVSGSGNTNLGLRDQRLALHWLQENIGAFGGNKDKVTIWGESAGALSVGMHLVAYNGRDDGLFRAGIMQSGNPVNYRSFKSDATYQPLYDGVVETVGCSNSTDNLQCLRNLPFETLNTALNTSDSGAWQPIVDGDFIARWGSVQLEEGAFVHVPVISGANTDEGSSFGPPTVNSTQGLIDAATGNSSLVRLPPQFADEMLEAYPLEPEYFIPPPSEQPLDENTNEQNRRSNAYFGDAIFIAHRRDTCQTWAAAGLAAYCYRFNTIPNGVANVGHFQEVAFVFDNTDGLGYGDIWGTVNPFANTTQSYYDLAELMSKSWISFIHDLEPNAFEGRFEAAPAWPVYELEQPREMVWDANVTELAVAAEDTYRQEGIQFILDHVRNYKR